MTVTESLTMWSIVNALLSLAVVVVALVTGRGRRKLTADREAFWAYRKERVREIDEAHATAQAHLAKASAMLRRAEATATVAQGIDALLGASDRKSS